MIRKRIKCPIYHTHRNISWVLADLATNLRSNEDDAAPYDQMTEAAAYIEQLEKALEMIENSPGGRLIMYRMKDDKRYPFK